jgi:hypothetical protein
LRGDAIRGVQVGFFALDPHDNVGAYRLLPRFAYAVTDATGTTSMLKAARSFRRDRTAELSGAGVSIWSAPFFLLRQAK